MMEKGKQKVDDRIFNAIGKIFDLCNLVAGMQTNIFAQWHESKDYSLKNLMQMTDEIAENIKRGLTRNITEPTIGTKKEGAQCN